MLACQSVCLSVSLSVCQSVSLSVCQSLRSRVRPWRVHSKKHLTARQDTSVGRKDTARWDRAPRGRQGRQGGRQSTSGVEIRVRVVGESGRFRLMDTQMSSTTRSATSVSLIESWRQIAPLFLFSSLHRPKLTWPCTAAPWIGTTRRQSSYHHALTMHVRTFTGTFAHSLPRSHIHWHVRTWHVRCVLCQ